MKQRIITEIPKKKTPVAFVSEFPEIFFVIHQWAFLKKNGKGYVVGVSQEISGNIPE